MNKGGKAKRLHRNITLDFVLRDVFPTRERAEIQGCFFIKYNSMVNHFIFTGCLRHFGPTNQLVQFVPVVSAKVDALETGNLKGFPKDKFKKIIHFYLSPGTQVQICHGHVQQQIVVLLLRRLMLYQHRLILLLGGHGCLQLMGWRMQMDMMLLLMVLMLMELVKE